MTTRYENLASGEAYRDVFGVAPPDGNQARQVWPRSTGYLLRAAAAAAAAPAALPGQSEALVLNETAPAEPVAVDVPTRELVAAQFGLVPHWVKSSADGRLRSAKLVNAKSETVSTTRAFHDAWLKGQRCIVPMEAFFEDDWRTGKAVPTRIFRIDGKPLGAAGIWACWTGPDGEDFLSFALLTLNANNHALLRRYQQPGSEKRMPVILNEGAYAAWLTARLEKAKEFMRQYPAEWLAANPVEGKLTDNRAGHGDGGTRVRTQAAEGAAPGAVSGVEVLHRSSHGTPAA